VEERAGVPNDLQKRCLAVMPILAIPTIANLPNHLFKDASLLCSLGGTAQQIATGFTRHGPEKNRQQPKHLPLHEDNLLNLLKAIPVFSP